MGVAAQPLALDDAAFLRTVAAHGMYDGRLGYLVGPQSRTREVRKLAACVVAETPDGRLMLIGDADLAALDGDVDGFFALLQERLASV